MRATARDHQQILFTGMVTPALPTPVHTPTAGPSSTSGRRVNINTAAAGELETLPGTGPVLAQRLLEYRLANGAFRRPEDIRNVKGIGDSTFEQLKDHIAVE